MRKEYSRYRDDGSFCDGGYDWGVDEYGYEYESNTETETVVAKDPEDMTMVEKYREWKEKSMQ